MHSIITFLSTNDIMVQMGLQLGGPVCTSFADIGTGLGKVTAHVLAAHKKVMVEGIEISPNRWYLSVLATRTLHTNGIDACRCMLKLGDLSATTIAASVVYSFDIAFPDADMLAYANVFNSSPATRVLVSFYKPSLVVGKFGFDVNPVAVLRGLKMHGSQSGKVGDE